MKTLVRHRLYEEGHLLLLASYLSLSSEYLWGRKSDWILGHGVHTEVGPDLCDSCGQRRKFSWFSAPWTVHKGSGDWLGVSVSLPIVCSRVDLKSSPPHTQPHSHMSAVSLTNYIRYLNFPYFQTNWKYILGRREKKLMVTHFVQITLDIKRVMTREKVKLLRPSWANVN